MKPKTVVPLTNGDAKKAVARFGRSPRVPGVPLLPVGPPEDVWLAARRAGPDGYRVGASELAAVLGISPYASPFSLWWSKQDGWNAEPASRRQRYGHAVEDGIAGLFGEDHPELLVCRPGAGLWGHPVERWLVATPDFLAVAADAPLCSHGGDCLVHRDAAGLHNVDDQGGVHVEPVECKGLALDTPLPTPTGWTTMRAVQVGNELFDAAGRPCRVTAKSEVRYVDCYRIVFDDGSSVVCDADHRWVVSTGQNQRQHPAVLDARTIARTLRGTDRKRQHRVPLAGPLELPEIPLPVEPYTLGCWLGDGSTATGRITSADPELYDLVHAASGLAIGQDIGPGQRCPTRTVHGLRTQLRAVDLLGHKHVPDIYLRASAGQRLALLQGLMDTDGTWAAQRHQAVFVSTVKALALAVEELAASLGERPVMVEVEASRFGTTTTAWRVQWRPVRYNPFRLSRKAVRVTLAGPGGQSHRRMIVEVRAVPTVPTQCVVVDSPDHTYLCTERMIPTHNSDDGGKGWGKPGTDQVPAHHRVQLLVQCEILGAPRGWLVRKEHAYVVEYDDAARAEMKASLAEGRSFVVSLETGISPDIDGHEATTDTLTQLHPAIEDGAEEPVPAALAAEFRAALDALDTAKTRAEEAKNRLRDRMGAAQYAVDADGRRIAQRLIYKRRAYEVPAGMVDQLRRTK
ncbi:hypothetical protein G3I24_43905 [Micromonospora aurantiaca]|nr:hypothetical protein [Micromonospora aurantiaca]